MIPSRQAWRRSSAIALAVAFLGMATSGSLMLFIKGLGFQLRMHPVHNLFGILFIVAGVAHTVLNWRALVAHLRPRAGWILGTALLAALGLLYVAGFVRPVDQDTVRQLDEVLASRRVPRR